MIPTKKKSYYDTETKFIRTVYGDGTMATTSSRSGIPMAGDQTTRLVNKDGSYSIEYIGYPSAARKRWRNVIHESLEVRWRWIWLFACISLPLSWLIFALIFYVFSYFHGDFRMPIQAWIPGIGPREGNATSSDAAPAPATEQQQQINPCIANVHGLLSLFLFSLETQETVGYGYRYVTEECMSVIVVLCIQIVFGAVLQACFCAVIWARMLRPKRRGQEILFSRQACVGLNDKNELCLMFRMSDTSGTFLVTSAVRLYVAVKKRIEGAPAMFSFQLYHMHMGEENGRDKVLFLWPTVAYHVIDHRSPIYEYSREDLQKAQLEFIAVAEGIVESTGLTTQTRTSYLPTEIQWGYRFRPMNFCNKGEASKVTTQYEDFDSMVPVATPDCSAKEWDEKRTVVKSMKRFDSVENLYKNVLLSNSNNMALRKNATDRTRPNTISKFSTSN
uniref:Uncharacterized protein n=1 Tax=Romanomermis culicivorax TaxID=13658 RepID=A0A915L1V4_ROMCU